MWLLLCRESAKPPSSALRISTAVMREVLPGVTRTLQRREAGDDISRNLFPALQVVSHVKANSIPDVLQGLFVRVPLGDAPSPATRATCVIPSGRGSVRQTSCFSQRGEEALVQRVAVAVPHRRPHAGLSAPFAEVDRRVLRPMVAGLDHPERSPLLDGHLVAPSTSSVLKCPAIAHATTRRLSESTTAAR